MNKNTTIGAILLCVLFMGMTWFNGKNAAEQERLRREARAAKAEQEAKEQQMIEQQRLDSISLATLLSPEQQDSLRVMRAQQDSLAAVVKYGTLAAATQGTEQIVSLENSLVKLDINTHGGMIESVLLKEYMNQYDSTQLVLFNADNNEMFFNLVGKSSVDRDICTRDLYFEPLNQTPNGVTMRVTGDNGATLDFVYQLDPDSYLVDFHIVGNNLASISNFENATIYWKQLLLRTENGRDFEERYSSLYYRFAGQSPDDDDLESSTKNGTKEINGKLTWFSFKNQFFSSALISNNAFDGGQLASSIIDENDRNGQIYLKEYTARNLSFSLNDDRADFCFFFGPNNYSMLNDYSEIAAAKVGLGDEDIELEQSVYLGWWIVRWVNTLITLPFFHWLDGYHLNYGLIILLMTLLIKAITFPFTRKSFVSSAKMRIAQKLPEVQNIIDKYPNQEDAMQKQQELMSLYGKMGVSQMGGCVPMLFQWPVLIALFYFFPTSIELRGQSFLWADDLSTFDAVISWNYHIPVVDWIFHQHISLFCVLMTATNIFYTWLMQKQNPAQQSMPGMQAMMYLMPLMFLAILNNYSAGLSYYYFLSTLFGIVQTYVIRATMDEDKILQQMKDNLYHPKKQSERSGCAGLMARAQEAQKQQQAEMRRQQKARLRKM